MRIVTPAPPTPSRAPSLRPNDNHRHTTMPQKVGAYRLRRGRIRICAVAVARRYRYASEMWTNTTVSYFAHVSGTCFSRDGGTFGGVEYVCCVCCVQSCRFIVDNPATVRCRPACDAGESAIETVRRKDRAETLASEPSPSRGYGGSTIAFCLKAPTLRIH